MPILHKCAWAFDNFQHSVEFKVIFDRNKKVPIEKKFRDNYWEETVGLFAFFIYIFLTEMEMFLHFRENAKTVDHAMTTSGGVGLGGGGGFFYREDSD
jgi:hypothetical protein